MGWEVSGRIFPHGWNSSILLRFGLSFNFPTYTGVFVRFLKDIRKAGEVSHNWYLQTVVMILKNVCYFMTVFGCINSIILSGYFLIGNEYQMANFMLTLSILCRMISKEFD